MLRFYLRESRANSYFWGKIHSNAYKLGNKIEYSKKDIDIYYTKDDPTQVNSSTLHGKINYFLVFRATHGHLTSLKIKN
jgi:hypothetical protein